MNQQPVIPLVDPNNTSEDGQLDFPRKEFIKQGSPRHLAITLRALRTAVQVKPEWFEHIQLRRGNDI